MQTEPPTFRPIKNVERIHESSPQTIRKKHSMTNNYQKITTGYGPEDIALDDSNPQRPRLLISCTTYKGSKGIDGGIWQYDLKGDSLKATQMTINGYKDLAEMRPHGISFRKAFGKDNLKNLLYVISHEQNKKIHKIIVFEVDGDELHYQDEYNNMEEPLIQNPNDLFVTSKGDIFYSNPVEFGKLIWRKKIGYVGYIKNGQKQAEVLVRNLLFPNGVILIDNELYVSDTSLKKLFKYHFEEGRLVDATPEEMGKIKGGDNISLYENTLLIANHPKPSRFPLYVYFGSKSPSSVYQFKLKDPNNQLEQIFYDKGKNISGSSTAIIYEDHLYVSQVVQNFILKVKLEELRK